MSKSTQHRDSSRSDDSAGSAGGRKSPALLAAAALGLAVGLGSLAAGCSEGQPPDASGPGESGDTSIADVLREEDPFARAARLARLLPSLEADAVAEVRALFEEDADPWLPLGGTEFELLTRFWAIHEAEEAARWAATESPHKYRATVLDVAVERWAEQDPEAAAAEVPALGEAAMGGINAIAAERALVRGWYASGHPGLVDYIRALPKGIERQRGASEYVRNVHEHEGSEALASWAESLPDEPHDFKLAIYRLVGGELARVDIEAAVRWCEKYCESEFGKTLRPRIARRWARVDGAASMEWLFEAPPSHDRQFAVRRAFRKWMTVDPEAASAWIEARGPEDLPAWLQPAAVPYIPFLATEAPRDALRWAETLEDERERELAYTRIGRKWYRQDPEAAEAWLSDSPLPEEAREGVRNPQGPLWGRPGARAPQAGPARTAPGDAEPEADGS